MFKAKVSFFLKFLPKKIVKSHANKKQSQAIIEHAKTSIGFSHSFFFVSGYAKDVAALDDDKEAFFTLFNKFIWDDDVTAENEGRQLYRRQGMLRRPMPMMFRNQQTIPGAMYRNFADQCYGLLCSLGLKGLARTLLQLTL